MKFRHRVAAATALTLMSLTAWGPCDQAVSIHTTHTHLAQPAAAAAASAPAGLGARLAPATGVDRWRTTAIRAGWPASAWPRLRCIIRRESGGDPHAYNGRDAHGGSRGLLQINGINNTWLTHRGIIRRPGDLYDPYLNLAAGRAIWQLRGWRPWTSRHHPC